MFAYFLKPFLQKLSLHNHPKTLFYFCFFCFSFPSFHRFSFTFSNKKWQQPKMHLFLPFFWHPDNLQKIVSAPLHTVCDFKIAQKHDKMGEKQVGQIFNSKKTNNWTEFWLYRIYIYIYRERETLSVSLSLPLKTSWAQIHKITLTLLNCFGCNYQGLHLHLRMSIFSAMSVTQPAQRVKPHGVDGRVLGMGARMWTHNGMMLFTSRESSTERLPGCRHEHAGVKTETYRPSGPLLCKSS